MLRGCNKNNLSEETNTVSLDINSANTVNISETVVHRTDGVKAAEMGTEYFLKKQSQVHIKIFEEGLAWWSSN